jgi:tryptophanyl-tRNA synthetase
MSLRNPLQKMSKSDNQEASRINLTDSPDIIRKKIRKAVTDSTGRVTFEPTERPGVSNLISIYGALAELSHSEVCERFEGKQTVDLKDELAELLVDKLQPICDRILELEGEPGYIDQVLRDGADKAKPIAIENLDSIMRLMGLL